jgi:hypothetical protein
LRQNKLVCLKNIFRLIQVTRYTNSSVNAGNTKSIP